MPTESLLASGGVTLTLEGGRVALGPLGGINLGVGIPGLGKDGWTSIMGAVEGVRTIQRDRGILLPWESPPLTLGESFSMTLGSLLPPVDLWGSFLHFTP